VQVQIYKLTFNNGFHLGAYGIGTESVRPTIPADTLFSALFSTWIRLSGDPDPWTTAFPHTSNGNYTPGDPPFLLTSAFPYANGTLFFPRPLTASLPELKQDHRKDKKDWKKVKFIVEPLFWRLIHNEDTSGIWPRDWKAKKRQLLQNGAVLISPTAVGKIPSKLWTVEKIPRVTLDRTNLTSNLYTVGRTSFAPSCGLWFGVNWRHPDRACGNTTFSEAFKQALAELSISGLGGDRNVGQGMFSYEMLDEITLPEPSPQSPAVLLSRYHPRADEIPGVLRTAEAYKLEALRGWGSSPHGQFRRRQVQLVLEGSVLSPVSTDPLGELIDISPLTPSGEGLIDHPVWRYGVAFLVGLGGKKI